VRQRIQGTLTFWKTQAIRYKAFHNYAVVWITVSTVAVPFIAQSVDSSNAWSKWCVSIIGAYAALLLALSRAFRTDDVAPSRPEDARTPAARQRQPASRSAIALGLSRGTTILAARGAGATAAAYRTYR
jgi:hypothetical protein